MTLDEAIIYCEEIAKRRAVTNDDLKYKREHRQIADSYRNDKEESE